MRRYTLAIGIAALSAIPTAAFSESIHVKPGGVSIGPSHQRHYNRYQGLYDLYESKRCRASRAACTHKQDLVEQETGECRRFRDLCD